MDLDDRRRPEDRPRQKQSRHIYDELQQDEIRVLRLISGSTPDKEIDCELITTTLSGNQDELIADPQQNGRVNDPDVVEVHATASSQSAADSDRRTAFREHISYEAVSWSWGRDPATTSIRVQKNGVAYDFSVSKHLVEAMKALRLRKKDRYLWIDAICINQSNLEERNSQVPKMDRIYGQATNVCIWVGAADEHSDKAIDFISKRLLDIWRFDELCKDETQTSSWKALLHLMRRDWFSRRWVVQEIALAKKGRLYCGTKDIDWQEFADAVSLFVHVETATHLLTDVMKRDQLMGNMPDYFGDVHALGAALLVDATRNLFRKTSDGARHSLLSLEYLISKYSVFQASQPRDTIYAFLSIARDTKAHTAPAEMAIVHDSDIQRIQAKLEKLQHVRHVMKNWGRRMSEMEEYEVNYALPVEAVYRDFVKFSIEKSMKTDPIRPLDIICRPWAPPVRHGDDSAGIAYQGPNDEAQFRGRISTSDDPKRPLPSWMRDLDQAAFSMILTPGYGPHMERRNADPLVGLPTVGGRNYSAAGTRMLNLAKLRFRPRHFAMQVEGFILDEVGEMAGHSMMGAIPEEWPQFGGWGKRADHVPEAFWRTLVADRGPHGQNPPTFYPRACEEALQHVLNNDIPLNTQHIINHGRCTIVAEFLRRVQAVIWNRRLMHTKYGKHLGLIPKKAKKDDLVCIFYGCSVPVLLRRQEKTNGDVAQDFEQDVEMSANLIKKNWKRRRHLKELVKATEKADAASSNPSQLPNDSLPNGLDEVLHDQSDQSFRKRNRKGKSMFIMMTTSHVQTLWSYMQSLWLIVATIYAGLWYNVHFTGKQGDLSSWRHFSDQTGNLGLQEGHALSIFACFHLGVYLVVVSLAEKLSNHALRLTCVRRILINIDTSDPSPAVESRDDHPAGASTVAVKGGVRHVRDSKKFDALRLPVPSKEWSDYVKKAIKEKEFTLPWSSEENHRFDRDTIVAEAPEWQREYYTLIGECYVHLMMDGEAIVWQAKDTHDPEHDRRKKTRIFELR
ncbi:heterokaryon incompatibility protein-domain-containing protein [Exophiala viscosa]|uniref:Heterokaryon incompatibility protein-domain-containing protein n=1 Tax=Exophiala viscosa TaxID=2486360 RepID=A0AAN6DNT8_9EURO|nr:heterokaryon incompatibility protein-domain-containing protein [Exophiala viscosa]